jgi:hypothetical protein
MWAISHNLPAIVNQKSPRPVRPDFVAPGVPPDVKCDILPSRMNARIFNDAEWFAGSDGSLICAEKSFIGRCGIVPRLHQPENKKAPIEQPALSEFLRTKLFRHWQMMFLTGQLATKRRQAHQRAAQQGNRHAAIGNGRYGDRLDVCARGTAAAIADLETNPSDRLQRV